MYRAVLFICWYCVFHGFLFVTSYGKIISAIPLTLTFEFLVEIQVRIPWNHSFSSMIVVCQTLAGSWSGYFVGKVFAALRCKIHVNK